MSDRVFRDRREAGRVLAGLLDRYRGRDDVVVLGLPGTAASRRSTGREPASVVARALSRLLDRQPVTERLRPPVPGRATAVAGWGGLQRCARRRGAATRRRRGS